MSLRRPTIAAVAACVALLLLPTAAVAAAPLFVSTPAASTATADPLKKIPVTGATKSGKHFTGTFTVNHFAARNGKEFAVGRLVGHLGNRSINRSGVAIPVTVPAMSKASTSASPNATPNAAPAAACSILDLVLGPLHLNLLGLVVDLNQVHLTITAVPGNGNLLGNLLCSVANLLNGSGLPLSQVTSLLNILNTLLSNPAVLGL
jgi:hypothetical protein